MSYIHTLSAVGAASAARPPASLAQRQPRIPAEGSPHLGMIDCKEPQPNAAARKSIWPASPYIIQGIRFAFQSRGEEIDCMSPQCLAY